MNSKRAMSEAQLCLTWNDFETNIKDSFGSLRHDKEFSDVTLVSEEGHQVEAHKVLLSISSPFFANLLKKNRQQHQLLIFMRGVKSETLAAVLDFLYLGETNVFQENVESFLNLASELQIKGLTGDLAFPILEDTLVEKETQSAPMRKSKKESGTTEESNFNSDEEILLKTENLQAGQAKVQFSGELQDLEEKVKSLMELTENLVPNGKQRAHVCKMCGKEGLGSNIKNHIETYHLEDICVPCGICESTFKTRAALKLHIRHHA